MIHVSQCYEKLGQMAAVMNCSLPVAGNPPLPHCAFLFVLDPPLQLQAGSGPASLKHNIRSGTLSGTGTLAFGCFPNGNLSGLTLKLSLFLTTAL
jgi:hypothetical protein